jgi:hypothetical protein
MWVRSRCIAIAALILLLMINLTTQNYDNNVTFLESSRVADDGSPPVISLLSPTNGSVVKPLSLIDIDVTDNVAVSHVLYHWDMIANETFESPYNLLARTSEVEHRLYVYANDTSGTWSKAVFYFVSDGTDPEVALTSPTNNSLQSSGIDINVTVTDIHLTEVFYSWDDLEILIIWNEPYSTDLISGDGPHTIHVYANDSAGNWIETNFQFIVDDDAPIISLRDPITGTARQSNSVVDVDVEDASIMKVLYNWNGDFQNTTWFEPFQTVIPEGETLHTLKVFANDSFGRWQHSVFQFIGDNTPPELLLESPVNESLQFSGTEVTISTTDTHLSSILFNWDNGINQTWAGTILIPLGDGAHTLRVIANDTAGNTIIASYVFDVDDSPPVVQSPEDFESDFSGGLEIDWAAVDAHPNQYIVLVNGSEAASGSWQSGGLTIDIPHEYWYTNWPYTLNCTIILSDSLGNTATDTVFVTIVSPPPPVDYSVPDNSLDPVVISIVVVAIASFGAVFLVLILYELKKRGFLFSH